MARRRLPYNNSTALNVIMMLNGEVGIDITEKRLRIGDGVTLGGIKQATKAEADAALALAAAAAPQTTVTALTATVALKATTAAVTAVDERVVALEDAQTSGLIGYNLWATLAAHATGALTAGMVAKVYGVDAGTHTDPVVGGTVANTGVYSWSASPAGWRRLGNLEVEDVATEADRAEAAVATVDSLFPIVGLSTSNAFTTLKLIEGSGSISPTCYQPYGFTSGVVYHLDIMARADDRRVLWVYCNGGALIDAVIDFPTRTARAGAGNTVTFTDLGNEWVTVRIQRTATATTWANVQLLLMNDAGAAPFTGDGASGLYVEDVFLHVSGATTSLLTSRLLSDASWTKSSCSVAAATITSDTAGARIEDATDTLDGVAGSKFIEGSGTISPSCYRAVSFTNGETYTAWAIVAADGRSKFNIYSGAGAVFNATFDLDAGTATGTGAVITALGNGEFLCEVTLAATSTTSSNVQFRMMNDVGAATYTGDGASGVYIKEAGCRLGSGTNLLWPQDDFTNAAWTKAGITIGTAARTFGSLTDRMMAAESAILTLGGTTVWSGVKADFLGTSITAQAAFTTPLIAGLGLNGVNLGVSGASVGANSSAGSLGIYNAIASCRTDAKVVSLEVTNDFGQGTPLGVLGDTTTATFHGALYAAAVAIRSRCPDADIRFATPYSGGPTSGAYRMNTPNANGNTLAQFVQAIKDVGAYLGIWVSDVGSMAGISYLTAAVYMSDDLHLNTAGGVRYSDYEIEDWLTMARHGLMGR